MQQPQGKESQQVPQTLSAFGKNYILAGIFDDTAELDATKANWHKAGHDVMVKKNNRLYVTKNRLRNF